MKDLVSLAKRRGFVFQSSEIYGGLNGFWDYGPLGNELKRNLKKAWWDDMVTHHNRLVAPPGAPAPFDMAGIDTAIISHPQVWKVSGHYDLFHDRMIDCRESKRRYRFDHLRGQWVTYRDQAIFVTSVAELDDEVQTILDKALAFFGLRKKDADKLTYDGKSILLSDVAERSRVLAPDATQLGTLTEPRDFNLMFETRVGAASGEEGYAFLRPETAQGIFLNFKNILDTTRSKLPLGIAQIGKSFRNEITPRNFTFRSREFEQLEMEFFCHPAEAQRWYEYWRDRRLQWYLDLGLSASKLRLREHHAEELSHYSRGTADIEYAFPFLPEGEFGELEGVAQRGDFDLRSHMEGKLDPGSRPLRVELGSDGKPKYQGSGKNLSYRDDVTGEIFIPNVIEPSAGADRAALAFLCEAYHLDEVPDDQKQLQGRVVMRLHPKLAPIKVAVLPLVRNGGMQDIARDIYSIIKRRLNGAYDEKDTIGRRYRRQDEVGTPYCITVDGQTLEDKTVTIRHRDTLEQYRVRLEDCLSEICKYLDED